ncbi:MAG: hypothetical protein ACKOCB_10935 [Planctomycetia bacterium]
MSLALAVLASLLALVAVLVAVRTERHVRRLARALAREWGIELERGEAPRKAAEAAAGAEELARMRHAVQRLEQQVRDLEPARAALQPRAPDPEAAIRAGPRLSRAPQDASPSERVVAHLLGLGYEDVVVLPGEGEHGTLRFEAREQGLPRKGRARVLPDGSVSLASAPLRAFP